ncbi:branched-chain amino acid ABC transporter substrate-binding protein [Agrobacterium sp. SHOUNA12C]|uniref:branched-chain amino acid ABC transporter substrate-binding protein n=1 Tax=Rhizobium rhizogenes TaxID=359 RepID=UPI00123A7EC5|nr:branched-chain amino acid ABC transporter substrate-binding protein [Rhizobium rhizogenes]KAA6488610.1 branched-chain amino acid ABC transporter substrate-binding protein [Agrobacterium sp. ICMP 7243]MCJ9721182.1 branched-chain amino acid ABC transporter substrate-binding protein [Agrobacterium sp. BETTINA12B]MCJ9756257.1 branched-chain amino acid ABC transporter substrate-binding protein [Agrobacterium sp. SHOUNA12C]NTF52225.1 ABC transporter substrate-binding protein [Rhizobium rhizogenes]
MLKEFAAAASLTTLLMTTIVSSSSAETLGPVTDDIGVVKIAKGDPILIGGYTSQSGGDTNQGIDELRGAEIAIADQGGKVLDFPVKLLGEDAQCTAEGGQTAATKLAGNKQIIAVVGPTCSSGARAGLPILANAGIPSVGIGATAPALTAADRPAEFKGFLRVVPNDLLSASFTVDYAVSKLGLKTVATIHDGSPYTEQLVRAFEKDFTAKGGTVVASEAISPTDTDMRPVLTRISTKKPDLIFTPVFTSSIGFILRQLPEVPDLAKTTVIGGEGVFSANVIEAAGKDIVGFRLVGPSTELFSERFPVFVKKFKDEYGEAPTGGFSAYGYDATLLTLDAIKTAAKTDAEGNLYIGRKALHDAMMASKNVPGLTGMLSCNAYGDCSAATYAVWQFVSDDASSFAPGENPKRIYP